MTAQAASANVTAIKQMIAQNDSWRDLQTGAVKSKHSKLASPVAAHTPALPPAAAAPAGAPLALGEPQG
jgi:hypothetical protein